MRFGLEIWVERARAQSFISLLASPNAPQFTEIDGNLVNRSDVAGIFTAQAMDEMKRRKNGEWQCKKGSWHERRQECMCREDVQEFAVTPISDEERLSNIKALDDVRSKLKIKSL